MKYNIIENNTFFKILNDKINNQTPTSVIRKGDGENIVIGYRINKGIKLKKYFKKMRHFNIRYYDFLFQKYFRNELIKSFNDSDFLGVPSEQYYHGYTSSVRKFDFEITSYYKLNIDKILIDSHFHLDFVKSPHSNNLINPLAQKIVSNKKIGVISHYDIESFLNIHNSTLVQQFSIPKRDAGIFNKMTYKKFNSLKNKISKSNNDIDLWIVAAGAYAKPFCNYIKHNNGIAIDLGSAIDTWAGEYNSRKYLKKLIN